MSARKLPEKGKVKLGKDLDGSYITGTHLARFGYVIPELCPLCHEGIDNAWHRIWQRKFGDTCRAQLDQDLVREALVAGDKHPLFARCLMYHPLDKRSGPSMEVELVYAQANANTEAFLFDPQDGPIEGDGSCYQPSDAWAARAGWSVVQVDHFGSFVKSVHGNVPGQFAQRSGIGEYCGLLVFSELICGYARYIADYSTIVKAWQSPAVSRLAAKSPFPGFWRIWESLSSNEFLLDTCKVTAHGRNASEDHAWIAINEWADTRAKQGAQLEGHGPSQDESRSYYTNLKILDQVCRAFVTMPDFYPEVYEIYGNLKKVAPSCLTEGPPKVINSRDYYWTGSAWRCSHKPRATRECMGNVQAFHPHSDASFKKGRETNMPYRWHQIRGQLAV